MTNRITLYNLLFMIRMIRSVNSESITSFGRITLTVNLNDTTFSFRLELITCPFPFRKNDANALVDHFLKQLDFNKLMKRQKSENNEATMESATMRG